VLLVAGACSAAPAGAPASLAWMATAAPTAVRATAVPTPVPTPKPTPKVTPEPKAGDLASDLRIGAPYKLVANSANASLTATFSVDVGGQHITATMNGREIRRSGTTVGAALVLKFSGISMSNSLFEASAEGGARNAGGKLSYSTVLGHRVAIITTPSTSVWLYLLHGTIVMVGGVNGSDTKPLMTSVIKAN
jgi:hypothetical protein